MQNPCPPGWRTGVGIGGCAGCAAAAYPDCQSGKDGICFLLRLTIRAVVARQLGRDSFIGSHRKAPPGSVAWWGLRYLVGLRTAFNASTKGLPRQGRASWTWQAWGPGRKSWGDCSSKRGFVKSHRRAAAETCPPDRINVVLIRDAGDGCAFAACQARCIRTCIRFL